MPRYFFLALILLQTAPAAGASMRDGLWEITTVLEGAPVGAPVQTMQQCLSAREIDGLVRSTPQLAGECRPKTRETGANSASWSLDCARPPRISGSGEVTYGESSFNAVSKLSMIFAGDKLDLGQRVSGRRIGDCRK